MNRNEEILASVSAASPNSRANYKGLLGYWCQAEAVFIETLQPDPGTAIAKYRQKLTAGDIAVGHNTGTDALSALQLRARLSTLEAEKQSLAREVEGYRLAIECYLKAPSQPAPLDFINQLAEIMADTDGESPSPAPLEGEAEPVVANPRKPCINCGSREWQVMHNCFGGYCTVCEGEAALKLPEDSGWLKLTSAEFSWPSTSGTVDFATNNSPHFNGYYVDGGFGTGKWYASEKEAAQPTGAIEGVSYWRPIPGEKAQQIEPVPYCNGQCGICTCQGVEEGWQGE
jgi:hypothetical protein